MQDFVHQPYYPQKCTVYPLSSPACSPGVESGVGFLVFNKGRPYVQLMTTVMILVWQVCATALNTDNIRSMTLLLNNIVIARVWSTFRVLHSITNPRQIAVNEIRCSKPVTGHAKLTGGFFRGLNNFNRVLGPIIL